MNDLQFIQLLLTNHNRPHKKLAALEGIVWHWTANENAGADARANRNYFNTTKQAASAHLVIDDHEIIQCVPFNEVAYHVGANQYRPIGQTFVRKGFGGHLLTPNFFLVGFELCVNKDGNFAKTYRNAIDATVQVMHKYNLGMKQIWRHYDITGKDCPRMFIDAQKWQQVKKDIQTAYTKAYGGQTQKQTKAQSKEQPKEQTNKIKIYLNEVQVCEGIFIEGVTLVSAWELAHVLGYKAIPNSAKQEIRLYKDS